ncbi:Hypothetical protein SSO1068 [Saccharolobus solfataricus P2]|uniref:Uncharacterized protein n=2 Tax=Saccharolobus solfataricus TaxID=2287 RepID=Q97Z64_SACS2|nr:Hypothetical protein SSO1068 [Saccharolobus solfataricus P2]SAI84652.1 uncharacterised protein [Saccharolobus solfataricus]
MFYRSLIIFFHFFSSRFGINSCVITRISISLAIIISHKYGKGAKEHNSLALPKKLMIQIMSSGLGKIPLLTLYLIIGRVNFLWQILRIMLKVILRKLIF